MRHETRKLDVPVGQVGLGTGMQVDRFTAKTVQVHGTFVGTIQLEGRISARVHTVNAVPGVTAGPDDVVHNDWILIGAPVTAGALISITDSKGAELAVTHLRTNVTAWTSGQPLATFGGLDTRTDN